MEAIMIKFLIFNRRFFFQGKNLTVTVPFFHRVLDEKEE